jgi:pimeloyl-ACP methyl ester carboxylesterase
MHVSMDGRRDKKDLIMLAELVKLQTSDGMTHYGALYHAEKQKGIAVVLVHGLTGRFVGEVESALPPLLAEAGYTCLVANNRGNGFIGAATERFSGSLPDIASALDFMQARGFRQIALLGHSKGGVKVTYYQARKKDDRVMALGILSPASNVHEIYQRLASVENPERFLEQARKLVEEGKGETILHLENWPFFVSAGTVWDHHTTTGDDVLDLLPSIPLPKLAVCGELELDWCQVVATLQKSPQKNCQVHVIPGADHVYTGCEAELGKIVIEWLDNLTQISG